MTTEIIPHRLGDDGAGPLVSLIPLEDRELPWIGPVDKEGKLSSANDRSQLNAEIAIDALFGDFVFVRFDEWNRRLEWNIGDTGWKSINDRSLNEIKYRIEERFGHSVKFIPPKTIVRSAVEHLGAQHRVNAQVDHFRKVQWDGVDRWPLFSQLLGQTEELGVEYCKLLMRGVVVRAHHPGATFPYCITLYSRRQGVGKGDLLKAISNG